jgi:hypothetical protein
MAAATRTVTVTRAEAARRAVFADYAAKAGRRSQASGKGHRWTRADAVWWGRLGGQCSRGKKGAAL